MIVKLGFGGGREREFRRHILQNITSSGASLCIALIATPVMTRIFSSSAYGLNGILQSTTLIVSTIGLLGLPMALARSQDQSERIRLMSASMQLAFILTIVIAVLVAAICILRPTTVAGIETSVLILIPLLVLSYAVLRIFEAVLIAEGAFGPLAAGRLIYSLGARAVAISVGFALSPTAIGMVVGEIAGKAAQIAVSASRAAIWPIVKAMTWVPRAAALKASIRSNSDYALYSSFPTLLPLVVATAIQYIISIRFGIEDNGQYVLAMAILNLPYTLIALSSAPIVFRHFLGMYTETPDRLFASSIRTLATYAILGLVSLSPFLLFGPELFALVFGRHWTEAGRLAQIMALPQMLAFGSIVLTSLFQVLRRLRIWFALEAVGALITLGGFVFASMGADFRSAISTLSFVLLAYHALLVLGSLYLVTSKGVSQP